MDLKKKFIRFVLPSIASMLVFNLYTMVDGIFIANYAGETALAAVNIAMPFINFMFAFSLLLSIGTSTLISIHRGAGRQQLANELFSMNTVVLTICSLIISLVCVVFTRPLALLLGAGPDTIQYVVDYLTIIGGFGCFYMVAYSFEVLIKADGFPQYSTFGVLLGAITNIVLDYIFVFEFHWGLKGAAWATGISQLLTFAVFLAHFLFSRKTHFHFSRFHTDLSVYRRIIQVGLADCITELSAGVITFAFNHQILAIIGTSGVISYTVMTYVYNLVLMVYVGIAQGIQPLISYSLGKKDRKTIHQVYRYALFTVFICSLLCYGLCVAFAPQISSIFIRISETVLFSSTVSAFRLYAFCFLLMGYNVVTSGFFVALACSKAALMLSLSRGMVIIVISLLIMSTLFGAAGIWISPTVSEIICLVISFVLMKKVRPFAAE